MFILGKHPFHKIFIRVLIASIRISMDHRFEIYLTNLFAFLGPTSRISQNPKEIKGFPSKACEHIRQEFGKGNLNKAHLE